MWIHPFTLKSFFQYLHLIFFQMLPWLMLYSAFVIFLTSLLIYFLIILENVWIKIILFLVVSPCLVITVACCLAVFCMYRVIKLSVKTGYVDIYLLEFSNFDIGEQYSEKGPSIMCNIFKNLKLRLSLNFVCNDGIQ